MAREEEIKEAAIAFCKKEAPNGLAFIAQSSFVVGALWADAHPHWISVKDRKPKLKHSEDNIKYSDTVIVTDGEYRTSARWIYSTWGGWYSWYNDGDEELKGITHWMPLPQPPKKGE